MPEPIATWNPTTQLWETASADLFSEQQEPYSATWPTSGTTRGGALYPLPASAPRTAGSAFSSSQLLPIPATEPATGNGHARNLGKEISLLPTPVVTDSFGARNSTSSRQADSQHHDGETLTDVMWKLEGHAPLLPTPSSHDKTGARSQDTLDGMAGKPFRNLNDTVTNELAVLPTPQARDYKGASAFKTHGHDNQPDDLGNIVAGLPIGRDLLPTPQASDGSGGGAHPDTRVGHSRQLIDFVLLCKPSASDADGGETSRSGARIGEPLLGGQAREMDGKRWGKYGPAIARWEAMTRPAPTPTEPNRNGKPRLNAEFSEWMMGWPQGWATDPAYGISRRDALRIIGNGVCPQQAIAAITELLDHAFPRTPDVAD